MMFRAARSTLRRSSALITDEFRNYRRIALAQNRTLYLSLWSSTALQLKQNFSINSSSNDDSDDIGNKSNKDKPNNNNSDGHSDDDNNNKKPKSDAIQSMVRLDSSFNSNDNSFGQLKSFIVPLGANNNHQSNINQWKPPKHIPILPLIIAKGKPHFMPYNFIYTINDQRLIDSIRYRMMTNQKFVSIFLRRFDLPKNAEINNVEDLMPYGTFGEIKELKIDKDSISILVQGHAKIKLKSFINQSISDHIMEHECGSKERLQYESSFGKNSSRNNNAKSEFAQLKTTKRQLNQLKKEIIKREKEILDEQSKSLDNKHEDLVDSFNNIDDAKPKTKLSPLLADTELSDEQFEQFSAQSQTPRIKALTAELVKSLSEIYFYNPLILEYIHLIYPQHQEMFESPLAICYFVAFQFSTVTPQEAYQVFACESLDDKLQFSLDLAKKELEMRRIGQQINKQVEDKIKKHHRKFLLQEQLKEIKKQLGVVKDDKEAIEEKIKKKVDDFGTSIPENIKKIIDEELMKLSFLDSHSSEFSVTKNYLDWLTAMPWGKYDQLSFDLKKTQDTLDADHYGMDDLKRRIVEFVAISKLNKNTHGKILCFFGPPGVGKTSIGKSIAKALNRKYFRFSVGGMSDVAEIKGHRRTYVGSMPGKIVQCLKKVQTMNPLVVIDEIDKIGRSSSHDGDCSSALLELLDPEQNNSFLDHYIDSPIDLSKILFICTANTLQTIPGPLRDRMELIEVNGYTPVEKELIAKLHLIPQLRKETGITEDLVKIENSAIKKLIEEYSRESGVRSLKKYIEKIFRRSAVKIINSESNKETAQNKLIQDVRSENLIDYSDRPNHQADLFHGLNSHDLPVGTATGLAYTGNGGSALYIESLLGPNINKNYDNDDNHTKSSSFTTKLSITGNVGKVMQESMNIALAFATKFLNTLHHHDEALKNLDGSRSIHIHVPEGATPKDGPSAGIAITSSIISSCIKQPIPSNFAMTGEICLNGNVLPVGGIREKLIAAKRENIKNVILPQGVRNQFDDIPKHVHEDLRIYFVSHYDQVYDLLFGSKSK